MPTPIEEIRTVAKRLQPLEIPFTFIGGAVLGLLVDDPILSEVRSTKDVDVVVEVVTYTSQAMFRAKGTPKPSLRIPASLRAATARQGFSPLKPRRKGVPPCGILPKGKHPLGTPQTKAVASLAPLPNRPPIGIAPASRPRWTGPEGQLLGCK